MLEFVLTLFVICVLVWAARQLMAAWDVPAPLRTTVYVFLVVLAALWLVANLPPIMIPLRLKR